MRFMNESEIEDEAARRAGHAVLGPATQTLRNLMEWANSNSDGWPYWAAPGRAAAKLMELITRDGTAKYIFDDERPDATQAAYRAALTPLKTFRTRQGADFEIVEELRAPAAAASTTAPPAMGARNELKELLGEGIHTALRKASGHPEARAAWLAIDRLPAEEWAAVVGFVAVGLKEAGYGRIAGGGEDA